MYTDRRAWYQEIEAQRDSRVLVYVTGDRPGMETQIHSEVLDYFADHLDTFGLPPKISLILYSRGGQTLAGWSIVNLVRHFCDEFEVIIPAKAHSTATLMALGADRIVMTKQATLGPIDPSTNSPLNPQIPGGAPQQRLPVSVEDVAAYFELARSQGITADDHLVRIFERLATEMHPVALGSVYRARTQIQQLAERLLRIHMTDDDIIKKLVAVLCSESGSHDYTINRREAQHELKLPIVKPDDALYETIRNVYRDVRDELQLNNRFDPNALAGAAGPQAPGAPPAPQAYQCRRILIESLTGGSHYFETRGTVVNVVVNSPAGPQPGVMNQVQFEGWEHEPAPQLE